MRRYALNLALLAVIVWQVAADRFFYLRLMFGVAACLVAFTIGAMVERDGWRDAERGWREVVRQLIDRAR